MDKRYWLFAYDNYYPSGGFCDFRGSFDSPTGALFHFRQIDYSEYQIFDSVEKKIVDTSERIESYDLELNPNLQGVFPQD